MELSLVFWFLAVAEEEEVIRPMAAKWCGWFDNVCAGQGEQIKWEMIKISAFLSGINSMGGDSSRNLSELQKKKKKCAASGQYIIAFYLFYLAVTLLLYKVYF